MKIKLPEHPWSKPDANWECFRYYNSGANSPSQIRGYFKFTDSGNNTFWRYESYVIQENQLLPFGVAQPSSASDAGCETYPVITNDTLEYKPELDVYFPLISFIIIASAMLLAYRIVIWRFIK